MADPSRRVWDAGLRAKIAACTSTDDFSLWTDLLEAASQETDAKSVGNAFTDFLDKYPLCYGYWDKYAETMARLVDKRAAVEVYKRGTQSIPLSIDLWISYVSYLKSVMETGDMEENQKHVREVYEEAIKQAGLDMRSDNLYNDYLQWLLSQSDWFGAANLCDRSLSTPLYPHRDCYPQVSFLTNYETLVDGHDPATIASPDELTSITATVQADGKGTAELKSEIKATLKSRRQDVFAAVQREVQKRTVFEKEIDRTFFHVQPVKQESRDVWLRYLDFEIQEAHGRAQNERELAEPLCQLDNRVTVLFERALIPCTLYPEFWIKYAQYVYSQDSDRALAIMERGSRLMLKQHAFFEHMRAVLVEDKGEIDNARSIFEALDRETTETIVRHANFEFRHGDTEQAKKIYAAGAAANTGNKAAAATIAQMRSNFHRRLNEYDDARSVLEEAIAGDQSASKRLPRLFMQLIELEITAHVSDKSEASEKRLADVFSRFRENKHMDARDKQFAKLKQAHVYDDLGISFKSIIDSEFERNFGAATAVSKKRKKDSATAGQSAKRAAAASSVVQQRGYAAQPAMVAAGGYAAGWQQPAAGQVQQPGWAATGFAPPQAWAYAQGQPNPQFAQRQGYSAYGAYPATGFPQQ